METKAQTLTEFLLARVSDDEDEAKRVLFANDLHGLPLGWGERMLTECQAKRRIIASHQYTDDGAHVCADPTSGLGEEFYVNEACPTLAALAMLYADHEDYRVAWSRSKGRTIEMDDPRHVGDLIVAYSDRVTGWRCRQNAEYVHTSAPCSYWG